MADAVVLGLAVVGGWAAAAALWRLCAPTFAKDLFVRTNFRGAEVPVAVGILLAIALVAVSSVLLVAEAAELVSFSRGHLAVSVLAAVGFGLLGLLDDLAGDASAKGFRGHLGALGRGELTTGGIKLFGGAAVAVLVASTTSTHDPLRLVADAVLIALAANLGNLLDRAPGRVAKCGLLVAVPIAAIAGFDDRLVGPAVVAGATLALLGPDLRERLMLGDTGANVIGALAGLSVVLVAAPTTRTVVLVVVALLNVASEKISFSAVIDRTPPLRWLDRVGRTPS